MRSPDNDIGGIGFVRSMLIHLTISNLAIIHHLDIRFRAGLNILSGETGAGKSIIINAVNLIMGGRASSDFIRSGAEEASVSALFSIPKDSHVHTHLSDSGFECDSELLIKRTISREGRNRIHINGSISTLQILSSIGRSLISISGQHEHQNLLKPESHLYLLDDYGDLNGEREILETAFGRVQSLNDRINRLGKKIMEEKEKRELFQFQKEEIDRADIQSGEDTLLEEERDRLRHARMLLEIVRNAYDRLYEREDAVISEVSACVRELERGIGADPRLQDVKVSLESVGIELEERALELRNFQKEIVHDPRRIEEIEDRLQEINRLKRKYGGTLEEIAAFRERAAGIVDEIEENQETLKSKRDELNRLETALLSKAKSLSKKRKKIALQLEEAIKGGLSLLGMKGVRFEVRFHNMSRSSEGGPEIKQIQGHGMDQVEFMLSPNIGEGLKPLSKIVSGGELSRMMLTLKTILARKDSVETVIFDEVDSGIAGAIAEVVGDKLKALSKYHQILCITHLPQIASKGTSHFLVLKEVSGQQTRTSIRELGAEERVREIARLLGGKKVTRRATAHAREMLG